MQPLQKKIVLAMGEVLWDCFPDERRPGGAPANFIYHAGVLGHGAVLCSRLGQDEAGDELEQVLRRRGLDTSCLQRDATRPTGRVTVDVRDGCDPSYEIHQDAAWDAIALEAPFRELLGRGAALCVGTLGQRGATSRATIQRCLQLAADALIVYDVNLRPPFYERAWIEPTLQASDVLKLNGEEMTILDRLLDIAAGDAQTFARRVMERYGLRLVCVTYGADGCLLVSPQAVHRQAGEKVQVADTVGAGDAFTAALTSALLRGWDLPRTAAFANRHGALVAGMPGAMPTLTRAAGGTSHD